MTETTDGQTDGEHSGYTRRQVLQTGAALTAGAALVGPLSGEAAASEADDGQDNPMKLWYPRPAGEWLEALPVGNGRLGAMVFGGVDSERLQLNEDTVWAGGPHDYSPVCRDALPRLQQLLFDWKWVEAKRLSEERFVGKPSEQMQYQPVGNLRLDFPHSAATAVSEYHRELDLETATTTVSYVADGVRYTRSAFVSHPDQVIVVRLTADTAAGLSFEAAFDTPQEASVSGRDRQTLALEGISGDAQGLEGSVRFVALARALTQTGRVRVRGDRLCVDGAEDVTLLISIGTSYRNFRDVSLDPMRRAVIPLDAASRKRYRALHHSHIRDYRDLFARVDIDLGTSDAVGLPTDERVKRFQDGYDPQLPALHYQFGRYLLISSSRAPSQPANLQGLWNEQMKPPWQSKYTININTEMNYWPAGPANLAECWDPLFDMIEGLAESGERTADKMYGASGWVAHHNTDNWRGSAVVDYAFYGLWPLGSAWLSLLFWRYYEYTGDADTLRRHYSTLKNCIKFYLDFLVVEPRTGWLVTNPSLSPEVPHHQVGDVEISICAGPTMDMQILRDLFDAFAQATRILGRDEKLREDVLEARSQLAPMQVGYLGQIQEWLFDWKEAARSTSRHISQLYGLFPSDQIAVRKTPDLVDAAKKTLELRGPHGSGWSLAWKMNWWARLEDPEMAYSYVQRLLEPGHTAPNLFDLHPPYQIDGNFGAVSGITEMLMQSHSGEVSVLPSLPASRWPTGSISGLRARGGFEIGVEWRDGTLRLATVRSLRGQRVRVRTPVQVDVVPRGNLDLQRPEPNVVEFDTVKSAVYRLRPSH